MSSKYRPASLLGVGAVAGAILSLGITAMAQRDTRGILPLDELRQFSDVFGAIKAYYVEPVEDRKLITEAISGMVTGLDPALHRTSMPTPSGSCRWAPRASSAASASRSAPRTASSRSSPRSRTRPAAKAGVRAGDLIVKIDDTPTKGMSLNDAVKLMRGKPKSPITLTLQRKGEARPMVLTVVRDVIRVQSVKSKLLEPGVGYVRVTPVPGAHRREPGQASRPAGQARARCKSLVLDLRNDPGGLLHGAVGVSAAFLPPRVVVTSTDGRTEDAKRKYIAAPEDYLRGSRDDIIARLPAWTKTAKMVVLTNAGSASASEIVAGALQDHKRAVVLGHAVLRQGIGPVDPAADQQHRDQADHRALLHAQRPLHPGQGHRARLRRRGDARRRHHQLPGA